jgi:hypothetical protein
MTGLALIALLSAAPGDLPPWAGVPLEQLPALALGEPSLHWLDSGWQAPLEGGGFVRVDLYASAQAALEAFEFQRQAAFTVALPDAGLDVPAAGDGVGALMVVDRNALITVRDPGERAGERAAAVRAALVVDDGAAQVVRELEIDGLTVRWDGYGRRSAAAPTPP